MAASLKERSQKEKSRLLKILVFSFAVLIFLAWIFNLQNRLKNIEDLTLVPEDEGLTEIRDDLDIIVEDLNTKLKDDKEVFVEKIQEEVEAETEKEVEAETEPKEEVFSKPLNNCPDYINCMPTIGGPARSCAIPPGCEGITQIVW
ncbi:hypothetical protein JXK06_00415 [Patescibacteria group bacterium]|nr:hypothetical protein [Patescibacteria group bacterium]